MELRWSSAAESELAGAAGFPNLGVSVSDARREVLLNRFPYRLVYDLDDAGVRIIAVAHQKQRPGYWQWRVEEDRMRYAA